MESFSAVGGCFGGGCSSAEEAAAVETMMAGASVAMISRAHGVIADLVSALAKTLSCKTAG
jgi:hypothetical protein